MVFSAMAVMNSKRPTIGDFKARVAHPPVPDVLVILDVSGSMTEETIRAIVGDVVSLSWTANAYLTIVQFGILLDAWVLLCGRCVGRAEYLRRTTNSSLRCSTGTGVSWSRSQTTTTARTRRRVYSPRALAELRKCWTSAW